MCFTFYPLETKGQTQCVKNNFRHTRHPISASAPRLRTETASIRQSNTLGTCGREHGLSKHDLESHRALNVLLCAHVQLAGINVQKKIRGSRNKKPHSRTDDLLCICSQTDVVAACAISSTIYITSHFPGSPTCNIETQARA